MVLLVGVRVNDRDSEGLGWISLVAIAGAFVTTFMMLGSQQVSFSGALVADNYTAFFYAIILIAAAVTVLMSLDYIAEEGLPGAEYYALLLFGTAGMMLMAAASDLIIVFLGLETMSISVYILAGLARTQERSNEAAMKYFLLGAFSTGFLLYGIALIYGATGTIKLVAISTALAHGVSSPMLMLGIGLMLIGFGFKVAAVPFHMWTPDVYEGAPTSVTAFMAVGVKLAAFSAFLRVFLVHLLGVQSRLDVGAVGAGGADHDHRQYRRPAADQSEADAGVLGDRPRRIHPGRDDGGHFRRRLRNPVLPIGVCVYQPRRLRDYYRSGPPWPSQ